MRIKEGFRMRKFGRDHIVVAEGAKLVNFNEMIVLNETSAYLWAAVSGEEFDAARLRDLLLARYEVEPERAMADAEALVAKWVEIGIAE